MGRHTLEKKKQLETEQQQQEDSKKKILGDVSLFENGEGESFECKVTKVSNGYIVVGKGETLVFSDEKYDQVLKWIITRRLAKMQPGEEIDFKLEQIFTKICRNKNTNQSESQLVA